MERQAALEAARAELHALSAELDRYVGLPASKVGAEVVLGRVRGAAAQLEAQLAAEMRTMDD